MNTIISTYEYEDLLKNYLRKNYYVSAIILFGVAIVQALVFLIVSLYVDDFVEESSIYIFLLPLVFVVVAAGLYIAARKVDSKEVVHFSLPIYDKYESEGTKVPLYRLIQQGKNSQTIYVIMDFGVEKVDVYDIRRKDVKLHLSSYKQNTSFKFYMKIKNGQEFLKTRFDYIANNRKHRLYGFKEVNAKLLSFCQNEGYQVEVVYPKRKNEMY